jgi:malonyl-CoA decarboxylase
MAKMNFRRTAGMDEGARKGAGVMMSDVIARTRRLFNKVVSKNPLEGLDPSLPPADVERLIQVARSCIELRQTDPSLPDLLLYLGDAYLKLPDAGRRKLLSGLVRYFDIDRKAVDGVVEELRANLGGKAAKALAKAEAALRTAEEPPRLKLLTRYNSLPSGMRMLVDLRADLRRLLEANGVEAEEKAHLQILDGEMKDLFLAWFDPGFMSLERVTWDSPASLLQKIIQSERVHEINGWEDLQNRVDRDRRLFAFFHPRLPGDPVIFVEVALSKGIPDSIDRLLDLGAPVMEPAKADTAVFYSINNVQKGLDGIGFGDHLIKQVVGRLKGELPGLKTFVTLSPIPGFARWLKRELPNQPAILKNALGEGLKNLGLPGAEALFLPKKVWKDDERADEELKKPLMQLAANYLALAKGRDGKRAADDVANFHLTNGACVDRINWRADTKPDGIRQSAGMMVNYLYDLDDIQANSKAYADSGEVRVSRAVKGLLK